MENQDVDQPALEECTSATYTEETELHCSNNNNNILPL